MEAVTKGTDQPRLHLIAMKLPAALLGGISVSLQQASGYSGEGE